MCKLALILAALLGCFTAQARETLPVEVVQLEGELADHPAQVLENARRDLAQAADDQARLRAMVRLVAAAGTLERLDDMGPLPEALRLADALAATTAWCQLSIEAPPLIARQQGAQAAFARIDEALERARSKGLQWCVTRLDQARGRLLQDEGRLADSAAASMSALRYYEAQDENLRAAAVLSELAWLALREGGDSGTGLATERGLAALAKLPDPAPRYLAATLHHNLAGPLLSADDPVGARTHLDEAMRLALEIGDEIGSAYIGRLLARVDLREKRPQEALARLDKAQPIFVRAGSGRMQHVCSTLRAEALIQLGRYQEALDVLAAADEVRRRQDNAELDIEHWRFALQAHARLRHSDSTAEAAEAYAQALRRRERESRRNLLAEANARFQVERRDAENRLLKEQQQGAVARQFWLVVSLSLMVILLAGLLWHANQQRRVRQQLKTLAEIDELTQLANRRAVMAYLRQQAEMAARDGSSLSVALCDIDHFKRVNDLFGHDVGDEALRCFARVGRQLVRRGDMLGRFGGEEFLLVLPATTSAQAQLLFDRLLKAVRAARVPGMPEDESLSFSMGVASWRPGVSDDELLREADQALYRAKTGGRARMEAEPEGAPVPAPGAREASLHPA
jgi:diguanylate cyclase (GGDEF)-like protein